MGEDRLPETNDESGTGTSQNRPTTIQLLGAVAAVVVAVTGLAQVILPDGIPGIFRDDANGNATTAQSTTTTQGITTTTTEPPTATTEPPTATTEPPTTTEPLIEVPVVAHLEISGLAGDTFGFFTDRGFLITWLPVVSELGEIDVGWRVGDQEFGASGFVVRRGSLSDTTLIELVGDAPPRTSVTYRNASSLSVDESIALYLGTQQQNPGTVIDPSATIEIGGGVGTVRNLLVTSKITATGQVGAPVVDDEFNIVGVSFAGSQTQSLSIAIERIQLDFPEAF